MFYFGSFLLGLLAINLKRSQKKIDFPLKPNCLLTRYPAIFISGKRSPFYCFNYWNNIPTYLKEHGYEIITPSLSFIPWQSRASKIINVVEKQSESRGPVHLVFDMTQLKDAYEIEKLKLPVVKKVHVLTTSKIKLNDRFSSLEIHQLEENWEKTQPVGKDLLKKIHDRLTLSPHYLSSQFLGSGSYKNNLTIEPSILKHMNKIAEKDWM